MTLADARPPEIDALPKGRSCRGIEARTESAKAFGQRISRAPREPPNFIPVAANECFLLFAVPTLDLSLSRESFFTGCKLLRPHQADRPP